MRTSAWHRWQQHAFWYREVALATLGFGVYMHTSRFIFGDELTLQHLLTPQVDEAFGLVMTYAAAAGLAGWSALRFRSRAHRIASRVVLGFIVLSVPLHLATFFGVSMKRFSAFPLWYSLVEAAFVFPAFVAAVWRLGCASDD